MLEVDGGPFPRIRFYNPSRHSYNGSTRGDMPYDHGTRTNSSPVSYDGWSENNTVGTHHNSVSQGGMALLLLQGRPAKDDPFIDQTVVSNLGRLADHHPHSVIDEEASADGRSGMDFNPR